MKRKMTSYLACAIAEGFCEGEGASEEQQIEAWQYLLDTGLCWRLQGWYGRTAKDLLHRGLIEPTTETAKRIQADLVGYFQREPKSTDV